MEDVRGRYVSPAIDQLGFNCPHCGALAKQFWFSVHADRLKADEKPFLVTAATVEEMKHSELEPDKRAELVEWAEQLATGRPSLRVNSRHASPRGAAALLRLTIQKLCKELGEKGKKPDDVLLRSSVRASTRVCRRHWMWCG